MRLQWKCCGRVRASLRDGSTLWSGQHTRRGVWMAGKVLFLYGGCKGVSLKNNNSLNYQI